MRKTISLFTVLLFLGLVYISPVSAQEASLLGTTEESELSGDSGYTLPEVEITSEEEAEAAKEKVTDKTDTQVQDFVSGVVVGVAVGFVGGSVIAWFLKPNRNG